MDPRDTMSRELQRRTLVQSGATAAAMISLGTLKPKLVRASDGTPAPAVAAPDSYQPTALSMQELETLKAATDCIIPPDDDGPGATDAGVFIFIDRTLSGHDAVLLPLFQAGLAALDGAASPSFAESSADEQANILTLAEAGELEGDPGGFFGILLEYTRQGMFSDPVHGGNIGFAGWDLISYPGIKLVWTEEDQDVGSEVTPEHISVEQYGGTSE